MALVRCQKHGKPKGRTKTYVASVNPIGYPETAAICGLTGCEEPGLIWLETVEYQAYQQGQHVFSVPNNAVKGRAA